MNAGKDGAVRAAGHSEAASRGARAAGEEAGQGDAPVHAGSPGGAVPAARAPDALPPDPSPRPAATAQQAAAPPQAPQTLLRNEHEVVRGERQGRGDGLQRRQGRQAKAVLAGAVVGDDDGAEPDDGEQLAPGCVQQPTVPERVGGRGPAELHGEHGVVEGQGAVAERAQAARHGHGRARARAAGAAAERQEEGRRAQERAQGRQDAALLLPAAAAAVRQLLVLPAMVVVGEAGLV